MRTSRNDGTQGPGVAAWLIAQPLPPDPPLPAALAAMMDRHRVEVVDYWLSIAEPALAGVRNQTDATRLLDRLAGATDVLDPNVEVTALPAIVHLDPVILAGRTAADHHPDPYICLVEAGRFPSIYSEVYGVRRWKRVERHLAAVLRTVAAAR